MNLQIQPKEVFRKGTATQINWTVSSYERYGTSLQISWSMSDDTGKVADNDIASFGNDVVSVWGTDDVVVDDALLLQLGLERAV